MNTDGDQFLKHIIQVFHDWWVSLGAAAWGVAGLLLFGGVAGLFLWLWVWRGGLLRRTALSGLSIRSQLRGVSTNR